jgi:DNA-directed RNA polymerase specialized sigma24 family protein
MLRILTNTYITEYQRRRRQREVLDAATAEQGAVDGVLIHEAALIQRHPEGVLLDRSVSDDVQRALDALPADFRTAVVLCDVEGLSYKEIADVMDCPVGTVMSCSAGATARGLAASFAVDTPLPAPTARLSPQRRRSGHAHRSAYRARKS